MFHLTGLLIILIIVIIYKWFNNFVHHMNLAYKGFDEVEYNEIIKEPIQSTANMYEYDEYDEYLTIIKMY